MVEKAVHYFLAKASRELNKREKLKVKKCLEFIKFGMGNTFLTFGDKYYKYNGNVDTEQRCLTIGRFESAWLADLVVAYLFESTEVMFKDCAIFGCYRDDEIAIFEKVLTPCELDNWLNKFQETCNEKLGSDKLQFTMMVWSAGKPMEHKLAKIHTDTSEAFPFLDMELYWNKDNKLNYRVHLKENQVIKYLSRGSNHPKACFKAIYTGVSKWLAKLTSITANSVNKKLIELYPEHAKALEAAVLHPGEYPTLGEPAKWAEETEEASSKKKKRRNQFKRQTFFPAGYHCNFTKPISAILMEVRNKHNIRYIRPLMSHHKFLNITELFQSDLNKKVMHGVISLDFEKRNCKCTKALKNEDDKCIFNGECCMTTLIYRVTCTTCAAKGHPMYYIGSMQNAVKD